MQCSSFQPVSFTWTGEALALAAFYSVSAQCLVQWMPFGASKEYYNIPVMRIRNHHHETCFSAGITFADHRLGYAWKLTCLVYLMFVFSECIALFLGSLSVVVTNYDSTMVTRVASLPLSGFSARCRLLLNKWQSFGNIPFLINYPRIGILAWSLQSLQTLR